MELSMPTTAVLMWRNFKNNKKLDGHWHSPVELNANTETCGTSRTSTCWKAT